MAKLSEEMAKLSSKAAKAQAHIAEFEAKAKDKREEAVATLKAHAVSSRKKIEAGAEAKGDEIESLWAEIWSALAAREERLKDFIGEKKEALEEGHAKRRADRLEKHAASAIEFALMTIEDAEYAVAVAIDARLEAGSFD